MPHGWNKVWTHGASLVSLVNACSHKELHGKRMGLPVRGTLHNSSMWAIFFKTFRCLKMPNPISLINGYQKSWHYSKCNNRGRGRPNGVVLLEIGGDSDLQCAEWSEETLLILTPWCVHFMGRSRIWKSGVHMMRCIITLNTANIFLQLKIKQKLYSCWGIGLYYSV